MSNDDNPLAPDCEHCDGTGRAHGTAYLADCEHCDGTGKVKRDPAIVDKARELTEKIISKAKAANDETLQNTGRDDADPHVVSPREALLRVVERHGFDLSAHARDVVCTGESFVMILPHDTPEEKRAEVEHDCNAVMPEGLVVYVQRRGGGQGVEVTTTPLSPGVIPTASASPPILCVECGKPVEHARECYASPTCYACLPPPEPLPECEPAKIPSERVLLQQANGARCEREAYARGVESDVREALRSFVGRKLDDINTRREMIDAIANVLPKLSKHQTQALLAKCDRGSQHCSECPAFGCCDNTAIRVREPDDALVAMRERECVGVPVVFRDPITGETSEGERGPVCERVSVFCACGQHNTHGGDRCLRCGQRIDEPGPSPDDLPRARATEPDDCRPCGGTGREGGYSARDDCPACGGTGKARRVDVTATLTHESGGMVPPRPTTPIAVCPLQPGLGSNLSSLLPKVDPRKTLDHVIAHAAKGDAAVHEFLCKLRDKYDALGQERDAYKYSAAYWWTHYQRAVNETVPKATDPEVRALVPGVQDGAEWREAIEWALGVEADPEEHTTEWAKELVRAVREIGNKAHVEAETMRRVARGIFGNANDPVLVEAIEHAKRDRLGLMPEDQPRLVGWLEELRLRRAKAREPAFDPTKPARLVNLPDDHDADAKLAAGIDPAAPTHDENGNPLSLGFLRCHFPASDKGDVMKLAASVGVGPDEKTKRTLSDMSETELREHAARIMRPRGPLSTKADMRAALATFGLEVVTLDDGDGVVTVGVSGSDPDTLPAIERELQESMPATLRLSLVPVPAHPYR